MTRRILTSTAVALALSVSSNPAAAQATAQQGGATRQDTTTAAGQAGQPQRMDSREFINQMAIAGMAEVQLGKLATERGADSGVKSYGQMMVKDHSQANAELLKIASQMKVQPPTELDQKHRDTANRLSKLTGAEFDREYAAAMVQGHQEVAAMLRSRAGDTNTLNQTTGDRTANAGAGNQPTGTSGASGASDGEQALTLWATRTLPTVQEHLKQAQQLQQKVK
jgi:putative membrane protein